ncbi:MAG: hypothetical protein WCK05_15060, partial [Planctomycetota bacterium]
MKKLRRMLSLAVAAMGAAAAFAMVAAMGTAMVPGAKAEVLDRDNSGTIAEPEKSEAPQRLCLQGFAGPRSNNAERVGFEPTVPVGTLVFET